MEQFFFCLMLGKIFGTARVDPVSDFCFTINFGTIDIKTDIKSLTVRWNQRILTLLASPPKKILLINAYPSKINLESQCGPPSSSRDWPLLALGLETSFSYGFHQMAQRIVNFRIRGRKGKTNASCLGIQSFGF